MKIEVSMICGWEAKLGIMVVYSKKMRGIAQSLIDFMWAVHVTLVVIDRNRPSPVLNRASVPAFLSPR